MEIASRGDNGKSNCCRTRPTGGGIRVNLIARSSTTHSRFGSLFSIVLRPTNEINSDAMRKRIREMAISSSLYQTRRGREPFARPANIGSRRISKGVSRTPARFQLSGRVRHSSTRQLPRKNDDLFLAIGDQFE